MGVLTASGNPGHFVKMKGQRIYKLTSNKYCSHALMLFCNVKTIRYKLPIVSKWRRDIQSNFEAQIRCYNKRTEQIDDILHREVIEIKYLNIIFDYLWYNVWRPAKGIQHVYLNMFECVV